jgi:hypothetical protein
VQTKQQEDSKKSEDPCRGKPKEFFVMFPANPTLPVDPMFNPLQPTFD